MKNQEQLIIITGPSGVGKGTVVKEILNMNSNKVWLSISATTRNPREGEENGMAVSRQGGTDLPRDIQYRTLQFYHSGEGPRPPPLKPAEERIGCPPAQW